MLKLLLDEHLPLALIAALAQRQPDLPVVALQDFAGGSLLGARDEQILQAAAQGGWTLLTYDLKTVPMILKRWSEAGIAHGGVVFVDYHTLMPSDVGGLLRGVLHLWETMGDLEWQDRSLHLARQADS